MTTYYAKSLTIHPDYLVALIGTSGADWDISVASGTVQASNLILMDSNAIGGATFIADATCVDGGNNTGWIFMPSPSVNTDAATSVLTTSGKANGEIRTIKEFEDIMQPIFARALGWDITSPDKTNDIRISWQTEGMPAFKISDNVIFIAALPLDHQINRQHDSLFSNSSPDLVETKTMTRLMSMSLIAYGSDAMENLKTLQLAMFDDTYRDELREYGIYYVPDGEEPKRAPEEFQGQWWERSDMTMRFNEMLTQVKSVNAVESSEVSISNSDGELIDFVVNI